MVDWWRAATPAAMGSDMPTRPRPEREEAREELADEATGVEAELGSDDYRGGGAQLSGRRA